MKNKIITFLMARIASVRTSLDPENFVKYAISLAKR